MHEVLINRLGGLSLPRKSVVRLTDRPDMTLDVYRGRKTTIQQQQVSHSLIAVGEVGLESHGILGTDEERRSPSLSFRCLNLPKFEKDTHLLLG